MSQNFNKRKYSKQKRFLLSSLYALCLLAKGINVNAEEKNISIEDVLKKEERDASKVDLEKILGKNKEKLNLDDLFGKSQKDIELEDIFTLKPKSISEVVEQNEEKKKENISINISSETNKVKENSKKEVSTVNLEEIFAKKEKIGFEAIVPSMQKKEKEISVNEMIEEISAKKQEQQDKVVCDQNISREITAGITRHIATLINKKDPIAAGITKNMQELVAQSYEDGLKNYEENQKKKIEEAEKETVYYDFPCPKEWQDYIFLVSEQTGIPFEIMMTILDQESDGLWNANGKISPTNDYGIAQINIINHPEINQLLGITSDELRYNPYKAIDAQAYLLKKFMSFYGYTKDNFDYENIFGTYNGGCTDWRKFPGSCIYAASCMDRLERHFGESLKLK